MIRSMDSAHGILLSDASTLQRPLHHLVVTESQLKKNRTIMTVVHFMLTYPRYSISLFLILASLSVPLPSIQEALHQPVHDLQYLAAEESTHYADCVSWAFERFGAELDAVVRQEQARSESRRNENRRRIQSETVRWGVCTNSTTAARRAMQTWQVETMQANASVGMVVQGVPWINDTGRCSTQELEDFQTLLARGPESATLLHSQVGNAFENYLDVSTVMLDNILEYAQARAEYDYDYFMGVKIQGALDLFDSFSVNLSLPQPMDLPLIQNLTISLQGLLDTLNDLSVRVDVLTVRLNDFHSSIQGFYTNYLDLYSRISAAALFVREFLPNGIPLPSSLDLSGIPLGDMLLPPIFELPSFPTLNINMTITDSLQNTVQLISQVLQEMTESVHSQVRSAIESLQLEIQDLLKLDDYNPPQFTGIDGEIDSLSQQLESLNQLGQATREHVLSVLPGESVRNVSSDRSSSLGEPWNTSNPVLDGESNAPFGYIEPLFPSFNFPNLVAFFFRWAWMFEFVIQLIRLNGLRRMYKRESSIELPEISYLDDEDVQEEAHEVAANREAKLAMFQLTLLKQLVNPWTVAAMIILPMMILGISVWSPHVVNACTATTTPEGTVLARSFIAPLILNNASIHGTSLHASAQHLCLQHQRQICSDLYPTSDLLYRQDVEEFASIQNHVQDAIEIARILDHCVDKDALDNLFELHCCGLEGYGPSGSCKADQQIESYCPMDNTSSPTAAFRPIGEYLANSMYLNYTLLESTLLLEDSRFDCSEVQGVCDHVPCSGVDADLLIRLTVEADCQIQLYLLKCCILVVLALYHAFLLNVCTTLAFRGAQRWRWRILRPAGIQFRTHMNAQGELVKGSDLVDRSARIATAMHRFERTGRIQILCSVALLSFWIISSLFVRELLSGLSASH